jgi:cobyrinic acid a,c-diamide synthase
VDGANPFLPVGTTLRGHEFHYSQIDHGGDAVRTVLALERGTGIGGGRDGVVLGSVFASYTHLHALGTPEWAPAVLAAAQRGGW